MSSLMNRNGIWYVWVSVDLPDGTKKIIRKSTGCTDKALAEKKQENLVISMVEKAKGDAVGIPPISLSSAIDLYLDFCRDKSLSTRTTYRNIAKKIVGNVKANVFSLDPDRFIHLIRTRDLDEYAAKRSSEGLKPASIALELKFICAVNNHARRLEYQVNHNLSFSVPRPKSKKRTFTDHEIRSVIMQANASDPRMSDLFVMLLETGCRVSEILRSQVGDYDISRRVFTVHRPKTNSQSALYITDKMLDILKKHELKAEPFSHFRTVVDRLRKVINEVCNTPAKSNLIARDGRATLHTTRHTYATRAAEAGIDLHALAQVLGHTSSTMSAKYAHIQSIGVSRSIAAHNAHLIPSDFDLSIKSTTKH